MEGRILTTVLAASSAIALFSASPAQATCPERLDLLKQFVDSSVIDQATRAEVDQLRLDDVESEQACERIVADLERRLNVEVGEDEVVRIGGETEGDLAETATDDGGIGVEGPPAKEAGRTLAASDQPASPTDQAAAGGDGSKTIGGGLDIPRDQIDSRYGPLAWLTFDEVIGADVIDARGGMVGEIIGLVRERPMGDFFAVVDTGAGEGAVVPINQFEIVDGDKIGMNEDSGDPQSMPSYDPERYEDVSG